ncbi:hypothetical protein D770_05400 [Flammeovirgaceae bacterium 311]|nr:hypothetical protein D770_05400 [Flammeovirgaceae bacterium 311]
MTVPVGGRYCSPTAMFKCQSHHLKRCFQMSRVNLLYKNVNIFVCSFVIYGILPYIYIILKHTDKMTTQISILGSKNQVIAVLKLKALKNPVMTVSSPVKKAKKVKADKVVNVLNIRNSWDEKKTTVAYDYNATINLTKKTIKIWGTNPDYSGKLGAVVNKYFQKTFKVGDHVEVDSYNLIYTGAILAIGEKTVLVECHSKNKRMNLAEFVRRNYDLNLEKIARSNADTRQYI